MVRSTIITLSLCQQYPQVRAINGFHVQYKYTMQWLTPVDREWLEVYLSTCNKNIVRLPFHGMAVAPAQEAGTNLPVLIQLLKKGARQ